MVDDNCRGRKVKKTASDEEDINENEGPDPVSLYFILYIKFKPFKHEFIQD